MESAASIRPPCIVTGPHSGISRNISLLYRWPATCPLPAPRSHAKMNDNPPTYQEATERAPFKLIVPFVHQTDLVAASLVSRYWYQTFNPFIWEEPVSQFLAVRNESDGKMGIDFF